MSSKALENLGLNILASLIVVAMLSGFLFNTFVPLWSIAVLAVLVVVMFMAFQKSWIGERYRLAGFAFAVLVLSAVLAWFAKVELPDAPRPEPTFLGIEELTEEGAPDNLRKLRLGALFRQGRREEAVELAAKLADTKPDDPAIAALQVYATSALRASAPTVANLDAAHAARSRLKRLSPDSPYVSAMEAFDLVFAGTPAKAVPILTSLLEREDISPRLRGWFHYLRGQAYMRSNQLSVAVTDLQYAFESDPFNVKRIAQLSGAYRRQGEYTLATEVSAIGKIVAPCNWRAQLSFLLSLDRQGRWDEGLDSAERASDETDLQHLRALYAVFLVRSGFEEKAAVKIKEAEGLEDTATGRLNMACYWGLKGADEKMFSCLRRALDLGLADPAAFEPDDSCFGEYQNDQRMKSIIDEHDRRLRSK